MDLRLPREVSRPQEGAVARLRHFGDTRDAPALPDCGIGKSVRGRTARPAFPTVLATFDLDREGHGQRTLTPMRIRNDDGLAVE